MSLSAAKISFNVSVTAPYSLSGISVPLKRSIEVGYTSGATPPNTADTSYVASLSVTSGAPLSIDLVGSTIKQADGTTAVFAKIGMFYIQNTMTTGSATLAVGGGTNSVFGSLPALGPGDVVAFGSAGTGLTVTASTADLLICTASSGTITFDLFVVGRSI